MMKSYGILIILIAAFIIATCIVFLSMPKKTTGTAASRSSTLFKNIQTIHELVSMSDIDAAITKTESNIILFYSPWCPHCRHFAGVYTSLSAVNSNVTFYAVNCVESRDICGNDKYKISRFPSVRSYNFGAAGKPQGLTLTPNLQSVQHYIDSIKKDSTTADRRLLSKSVPGPKTKSKSNRKINPKVKSNSKKRQTKRGKIVSTKDGLLSVDGVQLLRFVSFWFLAAVIVGGLCFGAIETLNMSASGRKLLIGLFGNGKTNKPLTAHSNSNSMTWNIFDLFRYRLSKKNRSLDEYDNNDTSVFVNHDIENGSGVRSPTVQLRAKSPAAGQ